MTKRVLLSSVLIVSGIVAGLVLAGRMRSTEDTFAAPPADAVRAAAPAAQPSSGGVAAHVPDFSDIATRAVTGVVNVSSLQVVHAQRSPFMNDPFFRYFFGDELDSQDRRSLSLGSGVIIRPDGYVITNNHVIGNNVREITAMLPDKREVRGRLIATDPMTDIALLKLDVGNLPVVPWGDSSKLKVGQWVLAIGSPFQLNQTVTLGIVSAVGRAGLGVAQYEDFIQTDAAINPGNSGGALIDARGDLVGINTAIYTESGGYQGVGFAVPSNLARRVADDLLKYGEVRRGSIGAMRLTNMTPELAEQLGLRNPKGVLVYDLSESAYREGLRQYDVITAFNGQTVEDASQLLRLVADSRIGSTATLAVLRGSRRVEIQAPVVQGTRRRQGSYQ